MEAGKTDTAAERFYTISEVARRLEVSDQSIRRWVKAGELRAYKPKKEYRIAESDLEEFLKERQVPLVQAPLLENVEEEPSTVELKGTLASGGSMSGELTVGAVLLSFKRGEISLEDAERKLEQIYAA
jgi:excisionase family DNA binding protein